MKRKRDTTRWISGQFIPLTIEMLRSPAFRVLSLTAHRILFRLGIELADHGGRDNGDLPVTFTDFEQFGVGDRHMIGPAIREIIALGFVELTKPGRSGNGAHRMPNRFRLTYLPHGAEGADGRVALHRNYGGGRARRARREISEEDTAG